MVWQVLAGRAVGVQEFHATPTPRIGGVVIVIGLLIGWHLSSTGTRELPDPILVTGLPAFCSGLAEDLTKLVSARARLFVTMASGVLAWLAVMLAYRNRGMSVWAPLPAVVYSIFDTVFTITRRVHKRQSPRLPDSAYRHSLIKSCVFLRRFPARRADLRNVLVSPFCWVVAAIPACLSALFNTSTPALLWSCLLSFGIYLAFNAYVAEPGSQQAGVEVVHLADFTDLAAPDLDAAPCAS